MSWCLTSCIIIVLNKNICLIKLLVVIWITSNCEWWTRLYKSVDWDSCFLTCCNCIDCKSWACKHISTNENIINCCLICNRVSNWSWSSKLNCLILEQVSPYCCLSNWKKNIATWDCHCIILIVLWVKTSFSILNLCTFLEYDSRNLSVLCENFLWSPSATELDSFWLSQLNFFWKSRHDITCLKRNLEYLWWTATYCWTWYVDSNVSTTDDNDIAI